MRKLQPKFLFVEKSLVGKHGSPRILGLGILDLKFSTGKILILGTSTLTVEDLRLLYQQPFTKIR